MARNLADFDGISRFGLGLLDEHRNLVAEARLVVSGPEVAEIAFLVRDDYQGRGIGSALIDVLVRHARLLGLECLHADVLASNDVVFHLLDVRGPVRTLGCEGSVRHVCLQLVDQPAMSGRQPCPALGGCRAESGPAVLA